MELEKIHLMGNKRLLLAGINEVEYSPKAKQQLILGTNGSGKSTLLNLMSPLPPSPGEYSKGGFQESHWTHTGAKYKLRSSFVRGEHPHSFMKDGVELNDGGTLMIQRKLVEMHFNYTPDLHELLIGNVKFTALTPQKRKEWLVKLCHVDVSYAISVYMRLQVTARNVLGARKHAEQRIVQRSAQLLGETELQDLKLRIDTLTHEIQLLTQSKDYNVQWSEAEASELRFLEAQIAENSKEVLAFESLNNEGFKSVIEIQNAIEQHFQQLTAIEARNAGIKKEFISISDIVKMLSQNSSVSMQDLESERNKLRQLIQDSTFTELQLQLSHRNDLKDLLADLELVIDPIEDLLSAIPVNPNFEWFNNETAQKQQDAKNVLLQERDSLVTRCNNAVTRITYLKSHDPVNCPKCSHAWVPGVSPEEIERLENGIPKANAKIEELNKQLKTFDEYFEALNEWKNYYARFRNYAAQYPRLKCVWDYYLEDYRLFNDPKSLLGYIRHFYVDTQKSVQLKHWNDRVDVIESAIEERRLLEGNNVQVLNGKLQSLDEELSVGMAEQRVLTARIDYLKTLLDKIYSVTQRNRQIQELMHHHVTAFAKQIRHETNVEIDKLLQTRQQSLASLSARYHDASSDVNMLQQYQRDLEELRRNEEDLKRTLDALSPTTGIIAQTLNSFISIFTQGLNKVISQIWTTPLSVLPCTMKDNDLDYRFPLWLGSTDKTTEDIANGSTGQKEIVDFAFVLVARSFLKLNHSPLILDEVGRTFTDAHRRSLFEFIKLLPSQLFIVSHFSNTHGALNLADVNVIDPTGVLVRPEYNKQFRIA